MAGFSRRKRGGDEYLFVDGKAMRADEVLRFDVSEESSVPGQAEAQSDASFSQESANAFARSRASLRTDDDVFGMRSAPPSTPGAPAPGERDAGRPADRPDGAPVGRPEAAPDGARGDTPDGPAQPDRVLTGKAKYDDKLFFEDRRKTRRKCLALGIVLVAAMLFSLCLGSTYDITLYSPLDVVHAWGEWFRLRFVQLTDPVGFPAERLRVRHNFELYAEIMDQPILVFKFVVCGAMLAVAGCLYQNTFRNPIAAPSMLGVSNGMSLALLLLVLLFGAEATALTNLYFIFSYVGGALVLLLVIAGGKLLSGKGRFNVVSMLLMGTIISQLSGVIMTFVQNYVFTDEMWTVYYELQTATGVSSWVGYITILVCGILTFVPVVLLRFQLNLVSFSDAETKLLGIDPEKLRALALVIGSMMVLTAQTNTGQVSMISLIVPFIARAVFGAEFRKQLVGTCLIGAIVMLVCGDISLLINVDEVPVDMGTIVTIFMLPLFVWMMAAASRSWE